MNKPPRTAPAGAVCLVSCDSVPANTINLAELSHDLVHGNKVITGTVNSNRYHFQAAHEALLQADRGWLEGLLTNHLPVHASRSAFTTSPEHIKTVIHFVN